MLQVAVGEGQQRGVQGALGVLENGVVLIDVLHYLRVELILLKCKQVKYNSDNNINRNSKKTNLHMPSACQQRTFRPVCGCVGLSLRGDRG